MQSAFDALHSWTSQRTDTLARHVAEGFISPVEFGDQMADLLTTAHTRAVVLGRHHAGDTVPEEADDREFAERVVDEQSEYLAGFVRDLAGGRYTDDEGNAKLRAISSRAGMYAARITGTANEAFALALPQGAALFWRLGQPETSHCTDCPEIEGHNPWTAETIPTLPGKLETACMANCLCTVETSTGKQTFRLPE